MYMIKEGERKKGIVVMVERWEIKRQIMKKKELEKKYTLYDLTKKEREMQRIIRKITKEEKKERKRSKS